MAWIPTNAHSKHPKTGDVFINRLRLLTKRSREYMQHIRTSYHMLDMEMQVWHPALRSLADDDRYDYNAMTVCNWDRVDQQASEALVPSAG